MAIKVVIKSAAAPFDTIISWPMGKGNNIYMSRDLYPKYQTGRVSTLI
jgi:hypothetical protein